ncbi:MAG TPA: hypothetical protein VF541_07900 [Longimicrobium sp.]
MTLPWRKPNPIRAAREYGLDLSLLTSALERSPEDRLISAAENAGCVRALRGESQRTNLLGMLHTLARDEVRFILVGGLAASAHGSAYLTTDLDICYDTEAKNVARLFGVLERWGAVPRDGETRDQRLDQATLASAAVVRIRTDDGDVDLFADMAGVGGYGVCSLMAETITVHGCAIRVLGLDALIAAKRAAPPSHEPGPLLSLEALRVLKEQRAAAIRSENGPVLS